MISEDPQLLAADALPTAKKSESETEQQDIAVEDKRPAWVAAEEGKDGGWKASVSRWRSKRLAQPLQKRSGRRR